MISTYIINLKRNTERKKILLPKLQQVNAILDIEWINAVDGLTLKSDPDLCGTFQVDTTWSEPTHMKPMTCGEIGCGMSHWNAWKKVASNDQKFSLVLEDDIGFTDKFVSDLGMCLDQLPSNTDLAYIYRKALDQENETVINDYWTRAKRSYWTCAYVLTKQGAQKLLRSGYINSLVPVDEFLPMMYDPSCRTESFKYNSESDFNAYAIRSINLCDIDDNTIFTESETFHSPSYSSLDTNLHVVTIISETNHSQSALSRWKYSCETYGIPYTIITDPTYHDLESARTSLKNAPDRDNWSNKYILFTDYNSTFMSGNPYEIIEKYLEAVDNDDTMILFPVNNYMQDTRSGFMGKTSAIMTTDIDAITQIDYSNILFQNVENSSDADITIIKSKLHNKTTGSDPKIICSGNNKLYFNSLENYTLYGHKQRYGFKLPDLAQTLPKIDIWVYLTEGKSYRSLRSLSLVDYPAELLRIFIVSDKELKYNWPNDAITVTHIKASGGPDTYARMMLTAAKTATKTAAAYVWILHENYNITKSNILTDCIRANRDIVAPLFVKDGALFSNFWGALDSRGFYKRSDDYLNIFNRNIISLWNVPYVYGNILVKTEVLTRYPNLFVENSNLDPDMQFCHNLRSSNELMYLLNTNVYGNITDDAESDKSVTLYDGITWSEEEYMHPDFWDFMYGSGKYIFTELAPDVWQFPIFKEEFCDMLIATADKYGKWSPGNENTADPRLGGGHENYPTQDIHMNQLGLGALWEQVVRKYYSKVMSKLYHYQSKGYNIAFIARYKFGEQNKLNAHHDASVYTTNMALNTTGVDYEGGGCRFVLKNISITDNKKGYAILHPGKLSHYHEGLPITAGSRYILVSFNE